MQGEEDDRKEDASSRRTLSDWLEAQHSQMLTALLPFADLLAPTLGSPRQEIASDLLVEVTRRALDNPSKFDTKRPPRAWLLGIARNVAMEWRDREIKWQMRSKNTPLGASSTNTEEEDPIARLISAAQSQADVEAVGNIWVENLLNEAPMPHQEIVRVYISADFDMEVTAATLGITQVNARQRLVRARKWFKDHLKRDQETFSPEVGNERKR